MATPFRRSSYGPFGWGPRRAAGCAPRRGAICADGPAFTAARSLRCSANGNPDCDIIESSIDLVSEEYFVTARGLGIIFLRCAAAPPGGKKTKRPLKSFSLRESSLSSHQTSPFKSQPRTGPTRTSNETNTHTRRHPPTYHQARADRMLCTTATYFIHKRHTHTYIDAPCTAPLSKPPHLSPKPPRLRNSLSAVCPQMRSLTTLPLSLPSLPILPIAMPAAGIEAASSWASSATAL